MDRSVYMICLVADAKICSFIHSWIGDIEHVNPISFYLL